MTLEISRLNTTPGLYADVLLIYIVTWHYVIGMCVLVGIGVKSHISVQKIDIDPD